MTTLPRIRWSDIVTAPRPDECDPIDHPRLKARAFEARVLIVCTIALLVTGYLTGAGAIDYARAMFALSLPMVTP
ncbi:MAG: hypothetical protein IPK85_02315 [Gemmatimonadetes bacterium]|nr:hypothetical protein [Gemmatimonadota bacterium]